MRTTRRNFVKFSGYAAATLPLTLPRLLHADSPNDKVNLGGIGVGGKGWSDLNNTSQGQNVIAICDVDQDRASRAFERYQDARHYTDWREMLDKEGTKLDGVVVSTPDHMHAPITMSALQLGIATYTQKPLTRTVFEARRLTEQARRTGVATQMGNQHHSGVGYRMLVQLIREGAIGKIKEVHTWSDRPIWPQGIDRPRGEDPVPQTLDWDKWLGVAPERPYRAGVYVPFAWRGWYDFGTGALGDMGCHIIDPVVWALELGPPQSVQYEGPEPLAETFPTEETLTYVFPGTRYTAGDRITMKWYDGGRQPPQDLVPLDEQSELPTNGCLFLGQQGALLCPHGGAPLLLPRDKYADYERPQLDPVDHYQQWTQAIKGEATTSSGFEYAGPLTETVLLGVIASRVGQSEPLQWNAHELKFTNSDRATEYVHEVYRESWHVEGLAKNGHP